MEKDRERKRQEILQRIKGMRLMDDEFMTKCFEDNVECTELVLRIIMDKDDLNVKSARTQYTVKNLQGRSVRLDIFADDSMDRKYNIEVQKSEKGAGSKRARYNSSLMDAFFCTEAGDMHYGVLSERVRYFKRTEEGVKAMSEAMEELAKKWAEEEVQEEREAVVFRMLETGETDLEKIAKVSKLSVEAVERLAKLQPV